MNSEKVKELKKFIEISAGLGCYYKLANCEITLLEVIEYINALESENERLLEQRDKTYNIWVKDTEKFKERIAEFEKELKEKSSYAKGYADGIKNTYEEVLPEFVERLKEKFKEKVEAENVDAFVECLFLVGDLLKEFLGK